MNFVLWPWGLNLAPRTSFMFPLWVRLMGGDVSIDGTYGKIPLKIRSKDMYSLHEMMDTYHKIEEKMVFLLRLIDKVYAFKSFLNGYIKEGKNSLVRHLTFQYFQFLVLNGVPSRIN